MLDKDKMKELAELMEEYKLTEIEYEVGEEKLCLKREMAHAEVPAQPLMYAHPGYICPLPLGPAPQAAFENVAQTVSALPNNALQDEGKVVKAPLVGTFYVAPGEGKAPYVKVGDTVKKGQIIGIIEAMKLMNEIESDVDGVVAEILAQNGKMVEFGQYLIRVK